MPTLKKRPTRPGTQVHNHFEMPDGQQSNDMVSAMHGFMTELVVLMQSIMKTNAEAIGQLTAQQQSHTDALKAILSREMPTPVVNMPSKSKPHSFYVELDKDDDGTTVGMRIEPE